MCNLARGLLDEGCDVDIVVGDASGPARDRVPAAARVVDLRVAGVARALPGLVRYLRATRPAGLVAAKDHANLIALAAAGASRTHVPVVVSVHAPHSEAWAAPERWRGRAVPALARLLYRGARAVVVVSEGIAEEVRASIPAIAGRIVVVPNPVVDDGLDAEAAQRPDHLWFTARDRPVLVCVGRLEPQKDVATLLDAFAQLRARCELRLVVVGDGSLRGELETRTSSLGIADDVDFVGAQASAAPYLAAADVVVLSSRFEGMPTVLIEALALGRRVVATDCPTGPRELLRGGEYGVLTPVGNSTALAKAIAGALTSDLPRVPDELLAPYRPRAAARRYLELLGVVPVVP
jgi:glycosyltransferase involved in cell wall biosynthesis